MTVDAGNLIDLVEAGVTQPVESEILKTAIPANLRGENNHWFALSMRARVLYAEKTSPLTACIMNNSPALNTKAGSACVQGSTLIIQH